ncbi:hypothetical protein AURDEDRAFT_175520 [Auricularia subglabra TFB-10046 SS5]|uniref:Uncharacterized protein n=1 Tax=Auricularia subglabra (strain TFB-10046 / SS5) TaxID=717982 RepID=J0CXF4_AURST|nr:hypothetical protein AURDEDRAFT_175520 [Auricularia subglabra TFB-10046 SS5]
MANAGHLPSTMNALGERVQELGWPFSHFTSNPISLRFSNGIGERVLGAVHLLQRLQVRESSGIGTVLFFPAPTVLGLPRASMRMAGVSQDAGSLRGSRSPFTRRVAGGRHSYAPDAAAARESVEGTSSWGTRLA